MFTAARCIKGCPSGLAAIKPVADCAAPETLARRTALFDVIRLLLRPALAS